MGWISEYPHSGYLYSPLPFTALLIELLRLDILGRNILVMPKNQLRIKQPLQSADHIQTAIPRVVVASQAPMRMCQLIVLRDVKLVRRPDERAIFLQVDLQNA